MPLDVTNWSGVDAAPDEAAQRASSQSEATALLIRARALLVRGWCQRASARNILGLSVDPYSRHAVAWCASGALKAAQLGASNLDCRQAICRLVAAMDGVEIWSFNDGQQIVEPVLAAFDRAIGLTEFVAEGEAFAAGGL